MIGARRTAPRLACGGIFILLGLSGPSCRVCGGASGLTKVVVDASGAGGEFRPLHGVNNGPIDVGGTVDLSAQHRALGLPSVRPHDAHWPNPDVVDIHALFPRPDADPARPESYDFARTDDYLRAIAATGATIVFRLGESIEHTSRRSRVDPPRDPERWAAVCVGIVRHYNEGWADGQNLDIRDWEVWNEPDNRPSCWTGTDDEYFRLYGATARALKRRFPGLRVGGPSVGNVGRLAGGRLEPTPFVSGFLDYCEREAVPPDFFSWHLYCDDPRMLSETARGVRGLLDRRGFARTASYLTEWNYLPDGDWSPVLPGGQGPARERFYDRVGGAEGAAFAAAGLLLLQDGRVDRAHYYAGDTNPFGLFTRHGVPRKTYHAFRAFRSLLDTPARLGVSGAPAGRMAVAAGADRNRGELTVLVVSRGDAGEVVDVTVEGMPWDGEADFEVRLLDARHDLEPVRGGRLHVGAIGMRQALEGPSVLLLTLKRVTSPPAPR